MPDLIASRTFRYANRRLQAGDQFKATKQDARVLVAIGRAELKTSHIEQPQSESAPPESEGFVVTADSSTPNKTGRRKKDNT